MTISPLAPYFIELPMCEDQKRLRTTRVLDRGFEPLKAAESRGVTCRCYIGRFCRIDIGKGLLSSSGLTVVGLLMEWHVRDMLRFLAHSILVVFLTTLTQIGGLAWVIAVFFQRRLITFFSVYAALTVAAIWIAPSFGRVALNCFDNGPLQVQSWMYCALNRNYIAPELADILVETAEEMERRFPGTKTLVLDANFPFLEGFPLLPHLSHDDGYKVDLAFFYRDETGYLPGATRSPIGYFAFEQGPSDCAQDWPTLRWNLDGLQPLWRNHNLDEARNTAVLQILSSDDRVGKIFVEPHLVQSLGVSNPSIRFQGCRAARHDDHIHFQLR